ncbi:hypothetical protein [Sinimarinibacterium thermocellulolyticum]|uniref:DUF885 domain-containing protein n=1 Tax=Sinimarinibacterium thermocellulolyticum TaxID=3170016 RepID=A0ABV2AEC5_9GAMM
MSLRRTMLPLLMLTLAACTATQRPGVQDPVVNEIAEEYVRLVLAVGEHDEHYVDAYYGPAAWREQVRAQARALPAIVGQAAALEARLASLPAAVDSLSALRQRYLSRQLQALEHLARKRLGETLGFDAEARALYDIEPPVSTEAELAARLAPIEQALPGEAPIAERYNAYIERFAIAPDRIEAVMRAAIAEARQRTAQHITLPAGERFELALLKDKPWSAYNWYQGNYHSRIEINTELPLTVTRAIELAVHEGYPGHHVYNALLERSLVRERGWVEYSVYPLYSPQSLIAEGSADYALTLAFPLEQRIRFVEEVLFPLAGFDPAEARRYVEVSEAARVTGLATIEAARRYLDGRADAAATKAFLQRYALASPGRAEQRLRFFDAYGAYIVNYALGESLVADYVERQAGSDVAARWRVFAELLATPQLPSSLR